MLVCERHEFDNTEDINRQLKFWHLRLIDHWKTCVKLMMLFFQYEICRMEAFVHPHLKSVSLLKIGEKGLFRNNRFSYFFLIKNLMKIWLKSSHLNRFFINKKSIKIRFLTFFLHVLYRLHMKHIFKYPIIRDNEGSRRCAKRNRWSWHGLK